MPRKMNIGQAISNILEVMEDKGAGIEMDRQGLKELADVDIRTVSKDSLVDIREVTIDQSMGREERIADYIRQVKNPYCFCCDGVIVKMSFEESGETLEDKLASYVMLNLPK